jgi:DeoR/GlpR family transcriptional regulator of sugar metabolism
MRYDAASERRAWILSALRTTGYLSIADLVRDLGVSDMTVRRDLRQLEETGEVRAVRGGVSLRHGTLRTSDFLRRAHTQADEKRRMALTASRLVRHNDTIALDSGTSSYDLAVTLPDDFTGTVVTPSVPIIQLMLNRPLTRLIGLGGELIAPSQAFAGPFTSEIASRLRVRIFFLGAVGVDARGVYVHTDVELGTKLALMAIAEEVVLLADSEKMDKTATVQLCPLDRLTAVVTGQEPPPETADALRTAQVRILLAPTVEGDNRTVASTSP